MSATRSETSPRCSGEADSAPAKPSPSSVREPSRRRSPRRGARAPAPSRVRLTHARARSWSSSQPRSGRGRRQRPRGRAPLTWSERPELVADEVHRRDEHDGYRLRDHLVEPGLNQRVEDSEVCNERERGNDEESKALIRDVTALAAERPDSIPRVVVGHGDEERADRCRDVVESQDEDQEGEHPEVDRISGRTDEAELDELLPVLASAQRGAGARTWRPGDGVCRGLHRDRNVVVNPVATTPGRIRIRQIPPHRGEERTDMRRTLAPAGLRVSP